MSPALQFLLLYIHPTFLIKTMFYVKSVIPNSCQYFGLSDFPLNLREIYSTHRPWCKFQIYPLFGKHHIPSGH